MPLRRYPRVPDSEAVKGPFPEPCASHADRAAPPEIDSPDECGTWEIKRRHHQRAAAPTTANLSRQVYMIAAVSVLTSFQIAARRCIEGSRVTLQSQRTAE